jgi:hypothetical protein
MNSSPSDEQKFEKAYHLIGWVEPRRNPTSFAQYWVSQMQPNLVKNLPIK